MKIDSFIDMTEKAAEEMENAAALMASDCRSKFGREESILLRARLLNIQLMAARAERFLLNVPVDFTQTKPVEK